MEQFLSDRLESAFCLDKAEKGGILIFAGSNHAVDSLSELCAQPFCVRHHDVLVIPGFVFQGRVYSYRIKRLGLPDREAWLWPPVLPETFRHIGLNQLLSKCQSENNLRAALVLHTPKAGVPLGAVHHLGSIINNVIIDPWELVVQLSKMRCMNQDGWRPLRNLTSELLQLYPLLPLPTGLLSRGELEDLFPGLFLPSRRSSEREDCQLLRRDLDLRTRPEYCPVPFGSAMQRRRSQFLSGAVRVYAYARYRLEARSDD